MSTDSLRRYKVTRLLAFVLLLLLCGMNVNAQFYSKRDICFGGTSNGFVSSIQVVNDTIYAMCAVTDTVYPYKAIGTFNRYDREGNVLSKNKFDIPTENYIGNEHNTLIRSNEGGFSFGGYTFTDTDNSVLLIKYDKNSNLQWYKTYSDSGRYINLYVSSFIQDRYSNYFLAGTVQDKSTYLINIFIAKIDSNGSLKYTRVYGSPSYNHITWSICLNQKQLPILFAEKGSLNTQGGMFTEFYELDTAGNPAQYVMQPDSFGQAPYSTISLADGGYICSGSQLCKKNATNTYFTGNICRFDSGFNVIWTRNIGPCGGFHTVLHSMTQLSDSSYLAVGEWYDPADTTHYDQYGWLVKFTADGTILWERRYRGVFNPSPMGDENPLFTVGLFSDNTIIAAGEALDRSATHNSQQGWLLHLDADGCLPDSNSCGIISGGKEVLPSPAWAMRLYPDPASDRFTLDYQLPAGGDAAIHLIVTDALGREVYHEIMPYATGSTSVHTSAWPDGLYYCSIISEAGLHLSKPVSVIH